MTFFLRLVSHDTSSGCTVTGGMQTAWSVACSKLIVVRSETEGPVFPVAHWRSILLTQLHAQKYFIRNMKPRGTAGSRGLNRVSSVGSGRSLDSCHLLPYWPSFQRRPWGPEDGTTWTMSAALNSGRGADFLEDSLFSLSCTKKKGKQLR